MTRRSIQNQKKRDHCRQAKIIYCKTVNKSQGAAMCNVDDGQGSTLVLLYA